MPMMRCRNANSCAEVLSRVFIQPSTASRLPRTRKETTIQACSLSSLPARRPILQLPSPRDHARSIYRSPTAFRPQEVNGPPCDEKINSPYVNCVSPSGKFFSRQPLQALLRQINRTETRLVQVAEGNPSLDPADPKRWPTAKLMSLKDIRTKQAEKEKRVRKQQKPQKTGKVVEVSWQIEPNDLAHRLNKARDFLEEGRKVEVLMKRKTRSKKNICLDDCDHLLGKIREQLGGVQGAKEQKTEGHVGQHHMTLFWEKMN